MYFLNETEILISNAHEKFESASILFENEKYPDAVSRAYYSMFFAAKALLFENNIHPRTHRGLISQFSLEIVKNGEFPRELFNILTRAQEDREQADYGFKISIDKKEAKYILQGSQKFLNECELILKSKKD